jgi:uncharacterized protein with HEPN domain
MNSERRLRDRLAHLQRTIIAVQSLYARTSFEQLATDDDLRAAFERYFELISEASRHIPPDDKALFPDIPWRQIADLGNKLRHIYLDIDHRALWLIVADGALQDLKAAVERIVGRHPPE